MSNIKNKIKGKAASAVDAHVMRKFVVAGIYEMDKGNDVKNFRHVAVKIDAISKEEAMGKAITKWSDDFPNYSLFLRPLVVDID
jgi:hypothetical protein